MPGDDQLDIVADLHRADAGRRAGEDQVAGQQGHHLREVAHHLLDREDHVGGVGLALAHLAVDAQLDVERMRIELGLDPRPGRAERVERLRMTEVQQVSAGLLDVARRHVVHAGVAEQVAQHLAGRRVAHRALHHHGELAFIFEPLGLRRLDHRLARSDQRRRRLQEEHRHGRDRQTDFPQMAVIVRAAGDDLARLARRQQLRRGERAHVAGRDDLAIRVTGKLADGLAFDHAVFRGVGRRVPVARNSHNFPPKNIFYYEPNAVGFTILIGVPAMNCATFSMLWLIMRADASTVLHAETGVITTLSIVMNG